VEPVPEAEAVVGEASLDVKGSLSSEGPEVRPCFRN